MQSMEKVPCRDLAHDAVVLRMRDGAREELDCHKALLCPVRAQPCVSRCAAPQEPDCVMNGLRSHMTWSSMVSVRSVWSFTSPGMSPSTPANCQPSQTPLLLQHALMCTSKSLGAPLVAPFCFASACALGFWC